jgi:nucleoid DNA-binding protein
MSTAALVEVVRRDLERNTSVAEVQRIVAAAIEAVKQGVSETRSARLLGFGTFKIAVRKARIGVKSKTRAQVKIEASNTIKFIPGKAFRELL